MASHEREVQVDWLRFFAVMIVIVGHYFKVVFYGGLVGVDIFLEVSGYVITKRYIGPIEEGKFSLIGFYTNRVTRILPAATTCLVVTVLCGYFFVGPDDFFKTGKSAMAAAFMGGNLHEGQLPTGYGADGAGPVNHYWSLGAEEQFYLLYPIILELLWRWWPKRTPIILGSVALCLLIWSGYSVLAFPIWSYYCPVNRAWEFLVGALLVLPPIGLKNYWARRIALIIAGLFVVLAIGGWLRDGMSFFAVCVVLMLATAGFVILRPEKPTRWQAEVFNYAGIALLLTACLTINKETFFPGFLALLPVLGTALIIVGGSNKGTSLHLMFSCKPLLYVGLISFSAYLWHWPLYVYTDFYSPTPLGVWHKLALIVVTLALAGVSYRHIEQRFTPWARPENKKPVFRAGALAMACSFAVALVVVVNDGWPERFGKLAIQPAQNTSGIVVYDNLGRDGVWLKQNGLPTIGDKAKTPTFLLAGDSHVSSFIEVFDKLGRKNGVSGFVSFRSGSLPIPGIWTHRESDTPESFMSYNSALEEFVRERNLKQVFLVGRWSNAVVGNMLVSADPLSKETDRNASARTLERHLFAFVARLKRAGVEVVIVQQLPEHPFHAYKKLVARRGRLLGVSREDHLAKQGSTIDMISRSGAVTVDLSHLLFNEDGYVRLVDPEGYPMWWDYDHVGGKELTRVAEPELSMFFKHTSQKGDVALFRTE